MKPTTQIVIYEDGADLTPDTVVREPVPPLQLGPVPWRGTGPERGEYEDLRAVEYIAPRRRAA